MPRTFTISFYQKAMTVDCVEIMSAPSLLVVTPRDRVHGYHPRPRATSTSHHGPSEVKPAHDLDRARPCPLRNISPLAPSVSHNEHAYRYTAKSERLSDPLYTDFGRQVWSTNEPSVKPRLSGTRARVVTEPTSAPSTLCLHSTGPVVVPSIFREGNLTSNVNVNDREERDLQPTTVTTAIRSLESLSETKSCAALNLLRSTLKWDV